MIKKCLDIYLPDCNEFPVFIYFMAKVKLKIMNGKHCAYVNAIDENGDSVFGKLIYNYIKGV